MATQVIWNGTSETPFIAEQYNGSASPASVSTIWNGSAEAALDPTEGPTPVVQSSVFTKTPAGLGTTLSMPSGIAAGELLVVCFDVRGSNQVLSGVPAGWTSITHAQADTAQTIRLYAKIADGSEQPWALSWGSSQKSLGVVSRISGARGVGTLQSVRVASGLSATVPAATTTGPNRLLLGYWTSGRNDGLVWALDPNMTEVVHDANGAGSGDLAMIMAKESRPTAGTTGSRTTSFTAGAATSSFGFLLPVQPNYI